MEHNIYRQSQDAYGSLQTKLEVMNNGIIVLESRLMIDIYF